MVDDVSTADDLVAVAGEWMQEHARRFSRVLLLRHRRNQGLAQARNTAFPMLAPVTSSSWMQTI